MPADNAPQVVRVPVKRYDVNLTLDDILGPLSRLGPVQAQARLAVAAPNPELDQLLQQFGDLVRQLQDVVGRINKLDPTVLAPTTRGQPPSA